MVGTSLNWTNILSFVIEWSHPIFRDHEVGQALAAWMVAWDSAAQKAKLARREVLAMMEYRVNLGQPEYREQKV